MGVPVRIKLIHRKDKLISLCRSTFAASGVQDIINKFSKALLKLKNDREGFLLSLLGEVKKRQIKKVVRNDKLYYYYKGDYYPDYLNHGNAISFIFKKAQKYCHGCGVDVGAGKYPFPGAIPIEDESHQNAYKLDGFQDNSLDFVFSSHCLEHLECWYKALTLWISKLKTGGILFLYLPHESMKLWQPGEPWVGSTHKWQPNHEILLPFLKGNGMEIIEYNQLRDSYWSFHIIAQKL